MLSFILRVFFRVAFRVGDRLRVRLIIRERKPAARVPVSVTEGAHDDSPEWAESSSDALVESDSCRDRRLSSRGMPGSNEALLLNDSGLPPGAPAAFSTDLFGEPRVASRVASRLMPAAHVPAGAAGILWVFSEILAQSMVLVTTPARRL